MKQIIQVEHNTKLRILTGRRWTSWLFHKCCWGLWSQEYRGTNPASGQGRTWSQGLRITSPVPLTSWPHCLLLKAFWKCQTQTILACLLPDKISYKALACTNTVQGYKQISCTYIFRLAKSQPHEWSHKFLSEQSKLLRSSCLFSS